MADTPATTKPEDDTGIGGFLSGVWNKIWDQTGGRVENAANDFISNNFGQMLTSLLEGLRSFFRDTMGWSTFGNGGMGAQMIDGLENAFKTAPAVTTPDPKVTAPALTPQ